MAVEMFGCVRNTIRLRSGGYFDFRDPQPDQFTLADIAGALSKICRFGGHCDHFYSVAEHVVHCARQARKDGLPGEAIKAVLLHDATEAFAGDMVKPLKIMMPDYNATEGLIEQAIAQKFGVDFGGWHEAIKELDRAMLIAERNFLFTRDAVVWSGEEGVRALDINFKCWAPEQAERCFTFEARRLGL